MYNRLKKLFFKTNDKNNCREDRIDNEVIESICSGDDDDNDGDDDDDDDDDDTRKYSILSSTFGKQLPATSSNDVASAMAAAGSRIKGVTLPRSIGGDDVSAVLTPFDNMNIDEGRIAKRGWRPLFGNGPVTPSSYRSGTVDDDSSKPPKDSMLEQVAEFYQQFPNLKTEVRFMIMNNTVVYLLGTNHADPQCPTDVANIIGKVEPQIVVIELCAWRACGCATHRGNIFQTKPEFTFRYLRRVISQIGFLPAMIFFTDAFNERTAVTQNLLDYGGEFAVAARLCEQLANCKILLGDREIPITVKRQASTMGNWRGIRLCLLVTLSLIFKRHMRTLLLRGHRLVIRDPRFYQIVVLERDIFLTYMIQTAASIQRGTDEHQNVVAVVGQGHLNGIQQFWGKIIPQILPFILNPEVDY